MPLGKPSVSVPDIFQERLQLSNELMFKSIKASMERLEEEVSVMVEILEVLQQEHIKDFETEVTS